MSTGIKPVANEIHRRLAEAFQPLALEVIDNSEQHRGHGGHREGVETHFTVNLTSTVFAGKSRVARQRLVYNALADLMDNPIHALSLKLDTP